MTQNNNKNQENIENFVENVCSSIENYKNYSKINEIYAEKIVKLIIKKIFYTREWKNPVTNKIESVSDDHFFILNNNGISIIKQKAVEYINNSTTQEIKKFIQQIDIKIKTSEVILVQRYGIGSQIIPIGEINIVNPFGGKKVLHNVIELVCYNVFNPNGYYKNKECVNYVKQLVKNHYVTSLYTKPETLEHIPQGAYLPQDFRIWHNTELYENTFLHDFLKLPYVRNDEDDNSFRNKIKRFFGPTL